MMRYVNPEVTFGQMVREHERLTQTIVDGFLPRFPKIDILMAVDMNSRNIGAGQMAKTWLPGRELPENEMWQLLFEHIITEEDYDYILKHGWAKFNEICLFERLGYDPESLAEDLAEGARNKKRFHDAGFPFTFGGMCPETFDVLAFGRGMMDFFVDLCERPETICAILDMMLDEYEENSEQQVREAVAAAEAEVVRDQEQQQQEGAERPGVGRSPPGHLEEHEAAEIHGSTEQERRRALSALPEIQSNHSVPPISDSCRFLYLRREPRPGTGLWPCNFPTSCVG